MSTTVLPSASIATRATGVALYVGVLIIAGWALALASGPDAYAAYAGLLGSPLGLVVLFGLTVSIFYHLAAGLRHLVWDSGRGFLPRTANATAWGAFGVAEDGAELLSNGAGPRARAGLGA